METLDNNYRSESSIISENHRAQFKDASVWIKTFSIIILILLGLGLLIFGLVFLFASESVHSEIKNTTMPSEISSAIEESWVFIKLLIYCLIALGVTYYIGCLHLLKAGNGFSALSFNPQDSETVKETFKNYRKFWTLYGYTYLSFLVVVIIFAILIIPSFV